MIKKSVKSIYAILFLAIILISSSIPVFGGSIETLDNGKYEVSISKDIAMGGSNFSDTVIIEKQDNNYYLTFSILDSTAISKMQLITNEGEVGQIIRRDGIITNYTYTLSKDKFEKPLTFRVFINAMKTEKDFNIQLDMSSIKKLSSDIDNLGERPAEFVPIITTLAGDTEIEKGSIYKVQPAKANLKDTEIPVSIEAYFNKQGEKIPVEIIDNQFMVDNVGEYHVIYWAESELFKTNEGKNTFKEIDVKITSKVGATSIAKIHDDEKVLPEGFSVQANMIKPDSETFNIASQKMKKISDKFEIISVIIYDQSGELVCPSSNIQLYLRANDMYDRNKIEVYHLSDNGELAKIPCENNGRYVKLLTDKTGNFIVCVPGTEFVMPMYGYLIIMIAAIIIIALAIIIPLVIRRKKRRTNN